MCADRAVVHDSVGAIVSDTTHPYREEIRETQMHLRASLNRLQTHLKTSEAMAIALRHLLAYPVRDL